jgi:hypothetical protein
MACSLLFVLRRCSAAARQSPLALGRSAGCACKQQEVLLSTAFGLTLGLRYASGCNHHLMLVHLKKATPAGVGGVGVQAVWAVKAVQAAWEVPANEATGQALSLDQGSIGRSMVYTTPL